MMQRVCEWVDVLDPTEEELHRAWPSDLHPQAIETLLQPHTHADEPRPKIETHGKYALAVLLVPVVVAEEDRVYYREVDILMAHDHVLTVRKTPPDGTPFDLAEVQAMCHAGVPAGMVAYHIVDEVAEGYLDMVDDVHEEIDELEDNIDLWDNDKIRRRLSDLRHDLLHIRRTLAPTRDAIRRVIDNRIEVDDEEELFPHDVELHFGDAYDKLLRSSEGLETARDLIGGVRDYHQSKVANDQNEVMKRLTLVASIFLPPTFIVGLYGQNFDWIPELHWAQGYGFSWLLIMISTVGQLIYFRRRGYL
ncbi:MAG: magnesium transporter [Acidimicrobiaceae bacterium]|jgi:magnesium transporter